ncbi:MAG TPA: 4-hydroxy-tetrahydrodipicolinate synthase [Salinivirgaceae bacterium]|nr:4-hydroxy-tetrahydrodipicolinate synthase [Salinivirgaceae bacterium]
MVFLNNFGLGTALITPFRKDGSIDFKSLSTLVENQISSGVDYLVALGTTSESPTLSKEEKKAVVNLILEVNDNRKPVIVGAGGYNTQTVIDDIKSIPKEIWGILSVTPYYNKPSQKGLYNHYKQIAQSTDKPIILYNVPGRTSVNLLPATTLELANDFKNIVAIKEASGIMTQIMEVIRQRPKGFQVISGDDAIAYPLIAAGANGVISVIGNAYPKQFADMAHYLLDGKFEEAKAIHYKLLPLIMAIFEDGNPSGIKQAMYSMGLINNILRSPLVPVAKPTAQKINALVDSLKNTDF